MSERVLTSPTATPASGSPLSPARNALNDARLALDLFSANLENVARIDDAGRRIAQRLRAGNKIMICGNGGSSCDAMHFAEELTGRFRKNRPALAAIACTDPGHLTCVANDFGFEAVFARWVEALGRTGDVLIVLSTSGDSRNTLQAVQTAKRLGMMTVALLGKQGGALRGACDLEWIVGERSGIAPPPHRSSPDRAVSREGVTGTDPALSSDRIQEVHMVILHTLVEVIERTLFPENY